MLYFCQSVHLPSPKNTEITHYQTPDKKKYRCNWRCGIRQYIKKMHCETSENTYAYWKIAQTNTEKFTIHKVHDSPFGRSKKVDINDRSQNYIENNYCQTPEKQQFTFVRTPIIYQRKWRLNTPQLMDNFDLWCPTRYRDSGPWDAPKNIGENKRWNARRISVLFPFKQPSIIGNLPWHAPQDMEIICRKVGRTFTKCAITMSIKFIVGPR